MSEQSGFTHEKALFLLVFVALMILGAAFAEAGLKVMAVASWVSSCVIGCVGMAHS